VHDQASANDADADADADADLDAILHSTPRRDGSASSVASSLLPPSSFHPGSGLTSLATSFAPHVGSFMMGHQQSPSGGPGPLGSHPRAIPSSSVMPVRGQRPGLNSVSATPSRRGYVNLAESPRQEAAYAQYQQVQQAGGGSLAPQVNLFPPSMGGMSSRSTHSPQLQNLLQ
jgi:hypothetical protein